jgi:hypothetical protein
MVLDRRLVVVAPAAAAPRRELAGYSNRQIVPAQSSPEPLVGKTTLPTINTL